MNTDTTKDTSSDTEPGKDNRTGHSFNFDDIEGMMNSCCRNRGRPNHMMESMRRSGKNFMGVFRWIALFPLLMAAAALLLAYYLSPENIVVLWMIGWGIVMGFGILVLLTMRILGSGFHLPRCCQQNFTEGS